MYYNTNAIGHGVLLAVNQFKIRKNNVLKFRELVKLLTNVGYELDRTGKGCAKIYRHPDKKEPISVHYHPGKEVKKGMAMRILKDAGIKKNI